jgi:hypothetical protein
LGRHRDEDIMRTPIHTPLSVSPTCDRVAALLVILESTPGADVRLTPLAVRRMDGQVASAVIVTLPDGGREALTVDEAQRLAGILKNVGLYPKARRHARELACAAAEADLEARFMGLRGEMDLLEFARRYGEAPSRRRHALHAANDARVAA